MIPYLAPPGPRLFAHRGASAHFPENTLPAFAAALDAGLTYLEMDVRATRDGIIVVHHDPTLLRLCGQDHAVRDLSLTELRQYDAGWGVTPDNGKSFPHRGGGIIIPTLREVLDSFPKAYCNIEIKEAQPADEAAVVADIRAAGAEDRVLLAAEQDGIMSRIRHCCGEIPTSLSYGETKAFFDWLASGGQGGFSSPGVALQIPPSWQGRPLVCAEALAAAHALGLEVHVWTINDADELRRLLALGVDGVMSDWPELLTSVACST